MCILYTYIKKIRVKTDGYIFFIICEVISIQFLNNSDENILQTKLNKQSYVLQVCTELLKSDLCQYFYSLLYIQTIT